MAEVKEIAHWQLLPGILDEITIEKIGPKLPWTTIHILSCVNQRWREAIRRHELYNARARSQSTQKLLALGLCHLNCNADDSDGFNHHIALYSVNDGSCHLLPPIPSDPYFRSRLLHMECVSLDGKLYALGGLMDSVDEHLASSEVYVMDLAGEGEWKPCASMQDPRAAFGCGVINGKIYVFGGISSRKPVCGSEVYDPVEDEWSPIAPMISFRHGPQVTIVGEELFVHGGHYVHSQHMYGTSDSLQWARNEVVDLHVRSNDYRNLPDDIHQASFAEVYRPLKNEWRIVKDFMEHPDDKILMVEGVLHMITSSGIFVYDSLSDSWTPLQSCLPGIKSPGDHCINLCSRDKEKDTGAMENKFH